jgi:hypothetical protein
MSKSNTGKKVMVQTTTAKSAPTVSGRAKTGGSTSSGRKEPLVFDRSNYLLMLAGIGVIALGLALMSGGAMPSPDVWDDSIIYSKRRTLVGPLVIILGLLLEIYAIFHKGDLLKKAASAQEGEAA